MNRINRIVVDRAVINDIVFREKMVSVHQALIGILFPVKSAGSKCSGRIGLENRIVEDRSKFVVIAAYRVEKILIVVENMELHAIDYKTVCDA